MAEFPCCKSCGSVDLLERDGFWGPHRVRVSCNDCGHFVKWGRVYKEVRRVEPGPGATTGTILEAIDEELCEAGDRLGLHWGFYTKPYDRPDDPIRERHSKPWPETVVVIVRGGDNEGWMIELWEWCGIGANRGPKSRIAMAKFVSGREGAFEYARLASIAAGVL